MRKHRWTRQPRAVRPGDAPPRRGAQAPSGVQDSHARLALHRSLRLLHHAVRLRIRLEFAQRRIKNVTPLERAPALPAKRTPTARGIAQRSIRKPRNITIFAVQNVSKFVVDRTGLLSDIALCSNPSKTRLTADARYSVAGTSCLSPARAKAHPEARCLA